MTIDAVKLIHTRRFGDHRGFFAETYNQRTMHDQGIRNIFVQDNHSLSREVGTLRGLHFQAPPHAQAKLVRCGQAPFLMWPLTSAWVHQLSAIGWGIN
jgi:dTDP-4-dehydrorhamnose 3,5-epimerase and related enzymes